MQLQDSLTSVDSVVPVTLSNPHGYSCCVAQDTVIGYANPVSLVKPIEECKEELGGTCTIKKLMSRWDRGRILRHFVKDSILTAEQRERLNKILFEFNDTSSLDDGERGETDVIEMEIHTEGAAPRKLQTRRMPLIVRQEVAKQLQTMQEAGVIPALGLALSLW